MLLASLANARHIVAQAQLASRLFGAGDRHRFNRESGLDSAVDRGPKRVNRVGLVLPR